jgi:hypothetical protein
MIKFYNVFFITVCMASINGLSKFGMFFQGTTRYMLLISLSYSFTYLLVMNSLALTTFGSDL